MTLPGTGLFDASRIVYEMFEAGSCAPALWPRTFRNRPLGCDDVVALGTPAIAAVAARRPAAVISVALRTKPVMLNLPKWITPVAKRRARLGCKLSGLARATSFRAHSAAVASSSTSITFLSAAITRHSETLNSLGAR